MQHELCGTQRCPVGIIFHWCPDYSIQPKKKKEIIDLSGSSLTVTASPTLFSKQYKPILIPVPMNAKALLMQDTMKALRSYVISFIQKLNSEDSFSMKIRVSYKFKVRKFRILWKRFDFMWFGSSIIRLFFFFIHILIQPEMNLWEL